MAPNAPLLSDWIGLAMLLALLFVVVALVASSRLPGSIKLLFYVGVGLRLVGAFARYRILWDFYDGSGDARGYFGGGIKLAERFSQLDFSPIVTWLSSGNALGVGFIRVVSGVVVTFIGHSMFTGFVVFSLLAFLGLVAFAVAYHRSYPRASMTGYLALIWLFPSLWYWPSSIGKEAVILMGLGLAVMGFIGKYGRVNWLLMGVGILIVFGVRPEIAGVLFVSMIMAHWLSFRGGWTFQKVLQGVVLFAVGVAGLFYSMETVGVEQFDVEGFVGYAQGDVARRATGGTSVEPVSLDLKGLPTAAFNVLFRPLPWEATNVMVLFASLEMTAVWLLVAFRRREFLRSLRNWRSDRFVSFSIAFIVFYSIGLGLMLVNLGIIARQRVFLFPFLFLLLEARPRAGDQEPRPRRKAGPPIRREQRLPAGVSA